MIQKADVKKLLGDYALPALIEACRKDRSVIRMLISLVYEKQDVMSWRAIEAIGLASGEIAKSNLDMIRNLSQRFLWMMRDESGNGPGSAPEILGEIVRNSPDAFSDIGQVITSFHDEKMLRRGVMRAIWRIAEKRPDLLSISRDLDAENIYINDEDAAVRAYALMIADVMHLMKLQPLMEGLLNDASPVLIYNDGEFMNTSVGRIAEKALSGLKSREHRI